jgi:hypothetical protein
LGILDEMEEVMPFMNLKFGEEKVMTWEERMLEGIRQIYTQFCGLRRFKILTPILPLTTLPSTTPHVSVNT